MYKICQKIRERDCLSTIFFGIIEVFNKYLLNTQLELSFGNTLLWMKYELTNEWRERERAVVYWIDGTGNRTLLQCNVGDDGSGPRCWGQDHVTMTPHKHTGRTYQMRPRGLAALRPHNEYRFWDGRLIRNSRRYISCMCMHISCWCLNLDHN